MFHMHLRTGIYGASRKTLCWFMMSFTNLVFEILFSSPCLNHDFPLFLYATFIFIRDNLAAFRQRVLDEFQPKKRELEQK